MGRDQLISWLNDAHAMEQGLIPILQNHADDIDTELPDAAMRIQEHINETQNHGRRIEECLALLDEAPSTVKSTASYVMGTAESFVTAMFSDELIKNVLMDYASEQFEVAAYTALVAAAEELGEMEVARLCEENRREDQLMAAWFERQIPTAVAAVLAKEQSRAT
jgi:ferritin-like metal-binding protein YciE